MMSPIFGVLLLTDCQFSSTKSKRQVIKIHIQFWHNNSLLKTINFSNAGFLSLHISPTKQDHVDFKNILLIFYTINFVKKISQKYILNFVCFLFLSHFSLFCWLCDYVIKLNFVQFWFDIWGSIPTIISYRYTNDFWFGLWPPAPTHSSNHLHLHSGSWI